METAESLLTVGGESRHDTEIYARLLDDPALEAVEKLNISGVQCNSRGRSSYERKRLREALTEFRCAVAAVPGEPGFRANLALVLLDLGKVNEAALEVAVALEDEPGHARASFVLGLARERQGYPEVAEAHYRVALANDPHQWSARRRLARLLLGRGESEEALGLLADGIVLDPATGEAYAEHVGALLSIGRYAEATRVVTEYRALRPRDETNSSSCRLGLKGVSAPYRRGQACAAPVVEDEVMASIPLAPPH